jgi:acyl-phosphate glycerol 3-phosphate acyltransferase
MSPLVTAVGLLVAAYLVGAIPFGYVVGRLRGVNLFREGSGNIGATNTARVLGREYGLLVFVLDFLKGAVPVAVIVPLAAALAPGGETALGPPDVLRVGAAAVAFLGHLFPVYLGFRGGKGVATGAGTIFVLVPGPAALAVGTWVVVLFASRIVSLASLAAVTILVIARLLSAPAPFAAGALSITLYLLAGTAAVVLKHRGNVRRLLAGTENRIGDFPVRAPVVRGLHVLALGLWFGGAAFFNLVTAPSIFESFKQVVETAPSDRTADVPIAPRGDDKEAEKKRKQLANALAGSAVGPVFPKYFMMQAACGLVALITALSWWNTEPRRRTHRRRVVVIVLALLTVAIGWPISVYVSDLRPQRFSPDRVVADAADAAFATWHLVSLFLSFVTIIFAGISLAMAAKMPHEQQTT